MDYILLLRPHQWLKNLFILMPAFSLGFAIFPMESLAMCFAAFCLASSSVYVANDIFDAERDRLHDSKKNRPIASGGVSEWEGWAISAVLAASALTLGHYTSDATMGFILAYLVLNFCYSIWTKHIPVVDCTSIALGFCLRFMAGGVGLGIAINPTLLATCFFSAMAMALVKRRIELSRIPAGSTASRPSLKGLTLPALDLLIGMFMATAISTYTHWTLSISKPLVIFTLPFLSVLISRVVWLAYLNKKGEDFSKTLVTDIFCLISAALFVALGFIGLKA